MRLKTLKIVAGLTLSLMIGLISTSKTYAADPSITNKASDAITATLNGQRLLITSDVPFVVLTNPTSTTTYYVATGMSTATENIYAFNIDEDTRRITVALKGDINLDGAVEPYDALYLQRVFLSRNPVTLTEEKKAASDINNDGYVDAYDGLWLARVFLENNPYQLASNINGQEEVLYMQDVSAWSPSLTNIGDTATAVDIRDGNEYTVARLADGTVWMTENLRFDISENGDEISESNTNNPSADFISAASEKPSSTTSWCTSSSSECIDKIAFNTDNINDMTTDADGHTYDEYGVYYNWYTATAGYGKYSQTNTSGRGDICPKGWHLPSRDTYPGDYEGLIIALGGIAPAFAPLDASTVPTGAEMSARLRSSPNNFLYSGSYQGTSRRVSNQSAYFWTARASQTAGKARAMFIQNGNTVDASGNTVDEYIGAAVRCITDRRSRTIVYDINGGDEGTMGTQSTTEFAEVTLYAPNFSRAGYGFVGWSENKNAKPGDGSTIYGPQENYTVPRYETDSTLTLYAIWVKSEGTIQNWDGCSSMNINDITALTDARDNNTYAVAKLSDGKCWMIENLRLDHQYTVGNNQNDPSVTNESLSQGYHSSFIGLAESEDLMEENTTPNSLYSTNGSTAATISGTNAKYRFPRYNNSNTASRGENTTKSGKIYSYGNYYSWSAAVADTRNLYTGADGTANPATSICPSGWRLPKSGFKKYEYNNDFWHLVVDGINEGVKPANYNNDRSPFFYSDTLEAFTISKKVRTYPNNFVYSGYLWTNVTNGSVSDYWSSTYTDLDYVSYLFTFQKNYLTTNSISSKSMGRTIRCLVNEV